MLFFTLWGGGEPGRPFFVLFVLSKRYPAAMPGRVKGLSLPASSEAGWYSIPKRCSTQREEPRLREAGQVMQEAENTVPPERFAGSMPFQGLRKPPALLGGDCKGKGARHAPDILCGAAPGRRLPARRAAPKRRFGRAFSQSESQRLINRRRRAHPTKPARGGGRGCKL